MLAVKLEVVTSWNLIRVNQVMLDFLPDFLSSGNVWEIRSGHEIIDSTGLIYQIYDI